jgi:hypothetical protein
LHQKALDPLALHHACAHFLDAAHSMDFSPLQNLAFILQQRLRHQVVQKSLLQLSTCSFYISRESALKPPKFLVRPIRANLQLAQCSRVNQSCVYLCNSFSEIVSDGRSTTQLLTHRSATPVTSKTLLRCNSSGNLHDWDLYNSSLSLLQCPPLECTLKEGNFLVWSILRN